MNLSAIPLVTSSPCAGLEAVLAGTLLGSFAVLAEVLTEAGSEATDPGRAEAAPSVLAAIVQQARNAVLAGGSGPLSDGSPSPILCHYI